MCPGAGSCKTTVDRYICGTVVTIAAYVGVSFLIRKGLSGIISHENVVNCTFAALSAYTPCSL